MLTDVDNPFKSPAILSLCTGMRGIEKGIERVIGPIRAVAYVEIEAFVAQNLVAQMESRVLAATPIWTDLKTFPSRLFHGKIHGITGGYPCQPFSNAGKRRGTEDPRHLWPHIRRIIGATRPLWCFFENVPGHIELGYREVRADLEALGYTVEEGIFSAEEVGAPHLRKRLFILAMDNACKFGQKQKHKISAGRNPAFITGETMADSERQSLALGQEQSARQECEAIERSGYWPARPGQDQFEWECSRAVESRLGLYASRYSDRKSDIQISYEIYTAKKKRAFEALQSVWSAIDSQDNEWTFGGLQCFLEQEILWSPMLQGLQNSRLTYIADRSEWSKIPAFKEISLRNMWLEKIAEYPSQGQECFKQLSREFADAMCILSHQITLARGQEDEAIEYNKSMQYLRNCIKDSRWDVSEALSAFSEVWRPLFNEEERMAQVKRAYESYQLEIYGKLYGYNYREDLLRMAGNAVVEQQAELAFRTLLGKFINA